MLLTSWFIAIRQRIARVMTRRHYRPKIRRRDRTREVQRLEDRTLLSAGQLDSAFGSSGKVTTDFGSSEDGQAIAIDSNGKIVVAGWASNGSNTDFAVARYNADGSLDTSFDSDGKLTTSFGSGDDQAFDVTIDGTGRIVVAGYSFNGSNYDFAVARYNADGSLDTSFDGDGKLTTAIGSTDDFANSVIIDGSGKIVVAGAASNGSNNDFALVRYNSDGSLDTSFDSDGKAITDFNSSYDLAYSVAIDGGGKIVAVGYAFTGSTYDFAVARYNADGSLDTSFDTDGKQTTAFGSSYDYAQDVAIDSSGKIVVAGRTQNANWDFAIARYNTDGSLDTAFDTDGKQTTDFSGTDDDAYGMAIDANGKVVLGGATNSGNQFALARYNSNGSLDTTFDTDGKQTTAFSNFALARDMTIDGSGKIVLAGVTSNGSNTDFALARYQGDGASSSMSAVLTSGNLTISDTASAANGVTVSLDGSGNVVITDANEQFGSAPTGGTLSNGNKTLTIALSGSLTLDTAGGSDSVTIDFSNGNPIPSGGLTFTGGSGGNDSLTITGGTTTLVTHTFTNANDGNITLAGALAGTITYTGLEPITDNLSATDRVFTFNGGAEAITLADAAGANMTIDSTLSESVTFANPTNSLTINAGSGDDTISLSSVDSTYAAALTVNGDAGTDAITLSTNLSLGSGAVTGDLSFNSETINLNSTTIATDLGTNAGGITLTGAITLGANVSLDTNGSGTDGSVSLSGTLNADNAASQNRTLTVDSGSSTVAFGGAVGGSQALADLDVTATTINLNGNLTADDQGGNTITLTGAVVLGANVAIDVDAASGTDNGLTISGSINADSASNSRTLQLATGGGTLNLSGAPIGASQAVQSFTSNSTAPSQLNSIQTRDGGISITAAGTNAVTLGGSLSTDLGTNAGNITINGSVDLDANVSIDTNHATGTDGTITINNAVNAKNVGDNRTLSLDAGGSTILFGAGIGGSREVQSLTVTSASSVTFNSIASRSGGINVTATTISLKGNVTTNALANAGAATFNGAAVIAANLVAINTDSSTSDGSILFNGTLNADNATAQNRALTLTADTGSVTFGGTVGGSQALADLDVTAATINVNANVTVDDQGANILTWSGAVVLGASVTFDTDGTSDNSVAFSGTINADNSTTANRTLTVQADTGTVMFGGNIGTGANGALADFDVSAATINLNGATIQVDDQAASAQTVTFMGAVVLGTGATIDTDAASGSDNNVRFTSTVSGANSLTISAGGGIAQFDSHVGSPTPLTDFDVTAATIKLANNVLTDGGSLTFAGNVVLNAAGQLTIDTESGSNSDAGSVTFSGGSISAAATSRDLVIDTSTGGTNSAGAVTLSTIDNNAGQKIRNLSVIGTTSTGTQATITVGGAIDVSGTVSLTGGSLAVNNTLASGGAVTLVANSMNLAAAINASGQTVTLHPLTNGTGISLGSEVGGSLSLTDSELDFITASALQLGDSNSGAITFGGNIDRGAGSTTAITLTTASNNNIALATFSLDAKNGDVTLTSGGSGAVTTSDNTGTDLIGNNLSLTAGSGGIGSSTNNLRMNATTLTTNTSGATPGAQFLLETDSVTIAAGSLNAGSQTIALTGGTFMLGGAGRINDNSSLDVNGATFAIGGNNETVSTLTLTSGSVTGSGGTLTSTNTIQTKTGSISAILDTTNGLTQNSAGGTSLLSGANIYTGTTTVSAGTLRLGNASALGSTTGGTTVSSGAVLDLNGQTIGTEAVTLNGTGISSSGALINTSSTAASLSGNITLASASSIGGSGNTTYSGTVNGGNTLALVGAGTKTFSGVIGGVTPLTSITQTDGTGAIQFNVNVSVASGGATFNANVTLDGLTFTSGGAVVFGNASSDTLTISGAATNVTTTSGDISLSSTTTGNENLTLNSAGGITFNAPVTMAAGKNFSATSTSTTTGINVPNSNSDIATSGTGTVSLMAIRNISLASGSSLISAGGDITLSANSGGTGSGNFKGISIAGATISTTGGSIDIFGRGGDSGSAASGIVLSSSGLVSAGGNGTVTLTGFGGTSSGVDTHEGVRVDTSQVQSVSGTITVTGTGGTASTDANYGVSVRFSTARISSSGGSVSVTGTGGGGGAASNGTGIRVSDGAQITAAGTLNVTGTGGAGSGTGNHGIWMFSSGTPLISSSGGNVTVTGTAGSAGTSAFGLKLQDASAISTTSGNFDITMITDAMDIESTASVNAGANVATLHQKTNGKTIGLGGADSGTQLGVSAAELARITAGTLNIGDTNSGAITVSAAITRSASTIVNLTTGTNNNIAFSGAGSLDSAGGNVTLTTSGTGAITSGTAANDIIAIAGTVSLNAGSGGVGSSGNAIVVSGTNIDATTSGNGNQFLNTAGSITIDSTGFNAGTGTVELSGAGTFTLGGSNRINDSTKLNVDGVTFAIGANDETVNTLTLTSGSITGSGGTLTSTNTIQTKTGSISAILDTTNGLTQNSAGGTTTVSGANTYTGTTSVTAGTLKAGNATALGATSSGTTVSSGAVLDLNGQTIGAEAVTLNGTGISSGGVLINSSGTAASLSGNVTLASNSSVGGSGSLTLSGSIGGGSNGLTKVGSGTATLGGTNNYTGATTVSDGTLSINGSMTSSATVNGGTLNGSGSITGTATVNSGGTLAGTLTISSTVTVNNGGNLSPGNSPGILTTADLVLESGSTLNVEVNGTTPGTQHDRINVTGTVTLNNPTLNATGTITSSAGQQLTLISNDLSDAVTGTFASLAEGSTVTINGISFAITYAGGSNSNDVILFQADTNIFVSGGNLIVTDVNGAATNDSLTIQSDTTNNKYVITDPTNVLFAGPGATQVDSHTVEVPFASVTGNIQVNTLGGDDSLTVSYSLGNFSRAIAYDGGTQSTGDSLTLSGGGMFSSVTHTYASNTSSTVDVTGNSQHSGTGVETITDSLTAIDRVFSFNGGTDVVSLLDATGSNMSIDSTLGAATTFKNPTGSVTINAGTNDDTVNVEGADATYSGALTINGDAGSDSVNFQTNPTSIASGTLTVAAESVSITQSVAAGSATITADSINVAGTLTANGGITLQPDDDADAIGLGTGAGTFSLTETELSNLASTGTVTIGRATGTATVEIADSVDGNINLSGEAFALAVRGGSINVTALNLGTNAVTLTANTGAITDGGAGTSDVAAGLLTMTAVSGIGSSDALETNATTLVASTSAAGNIRVTDASGLTLGSGGSGVATLNGDVEVTAAGTITVSQVVNARGGGNVSLTASTGNIQVNVNVLSTAATSGSAGDGNGTLTLDSTLGAITTNGSGTLRASGATGKLNLQAATGAGTSGNRLLTDVAQLAADLSTSGGLFVTETNDLSIATVSSQVGISLNGNTGDILLSTGTLTVPDSLAQHGIRNSSGTVTLTADDFTLGTGGANLALSDAVGSMTIQNLTANRQIDLGSNTIGRLSLSSDEMNEILVGSLTIGRHDASQSGQMTISADVTSSGGSVVLRTGASVTGTAGSITADNLAIYAGGAVNMTATNSVSTLAVSASGQTVTFVEGNGLIVGQTGGVDGITSDTLSLTVNTGNLEVAAISGVTNEINSSGTVTLNAVADEAFILIDSGANVRGVSGDHLYVADNMTLDGTITATGRIVTLRSNVATDAIRLGAADDSMANTLEFSAAELDHVTATTLRIGTTSAGAVTVGTDVAPLNITNLHLSTGGAVTGTSGGIGNNRNVAIEAGGTVEITDANTSFSTLAISAAGQDITIIEADGFTVGDVDGVSGISGKNISLTATTGNLTISDGAATNDIAASGTVSLETSAENALLTIATGAVISGTSADHTYTADKMNIQGTINATGRIVTLKPKTSGDTIDVGSILDNSSNTVLELSDAELDRITAAKIVLGSSTTGSITIRDTISPAGTANLTLTSGGNGSLIFSGLTAMLNVTGNLVIALNSAGTGGVTAGAAAIDIFADHLDITAGTDGIGAASNLLTFDVNTLTTITGNDGSQYLSEANSVTIDSAGLNAGNGTILVQGGTFNLGGSGRIADTSLLTVDGATFVIANNDETVATLTLMSGSITGTTGILTSTNTIQAKSGSSSAILAGTNGLFKTTSGTVTLSAANIYSGNTTVGAGTLTITGTLNDVTDVSVSTGATYNVANSDTIDGLSGSGNVTVQAGQTLTVGGNNEASTTFSGRISGAGSLTKTGSGTQILSGANNYTGATTIDSGRLQVDGSITSSVMVNSSGTLSGSGSVTGNVSGDGTVAPGASASGVLTINGNYTQSAASRLNIELGGTSVGTQYDRLAVNGIVTLGGQLQLSLINGFVPAPSQSEGFRILDNDAADAILGTFTGLPEGTLIMVGGTQMKLTYIGGTGNDINLSVPLPDIIADSVTTNGLTTLALQYEILESAIPTPMTIRFLKTVGMVDTLLTTLVISNASDLAIGTHTLNYTIGSSANQVKLPGAGFAEDTSDYSLKVILDPANEFEELDAHPTNDDNSLTFSASYVGSKTLYVNLGSADDTVTVTYPSARTGSTNLTTAGSLAINQNYGYDTITQIRVRTHGGNDTYSVTNLGNLTNRTSLIVGGDGDDSLSGGTGADSIFGGAGADTITGLKGNDSLDGGLGNDRLQETSDVNFVLSNTQLTGLGTDSHTGFELVQLTGGTGAKKFTVSGFTGTANLVGGGGADTIVAAKNTNFTLSNASLQTGDGMNVSLTGFSKATLTGGDGSNSFDVSSWTGAATVTGGNGNDTIVATRDVSLTLSSKSLMAAGYGTVKLTTVEQAELTGGTGDNTFTVSGWTGAATLTGGGGNDTVVATRNFNFTLSDDRLQTSDGLNVELVGIVAARLTGGKANNTFTLNDWTGTGSITGGGGTDTLIATLDNDTTLSDRQLVVDIGMSMSLSGLTLAVLTTDLTNEILISSGWQSTSLERTATEAILRLKRTT